MEEVKKLSFTEDFMWEVVAALTSDEDNANTFFDINSFQDMLINIDADRGTNFTGEWFDLFDYLPLVISDELIDNLADRELAHTIQIQADNSGKKLTYSFDISEPLTKLEVGQLIQDEIKSHKFIIK